MSRDFVKVCQNIVLLIWILNVIVRVDGRKAIQPMEDVEDIIKRINTINLNDIDTEGPPCLLDVQRDFPKANTPQPLYIIPDTNKFWLPNERGQLQIPRGASIELHCSKSFANATQENTSSSSGSNNKSKNNIKFNNILKVPRNTQTLRPRCLHDKTFLWQGEKYEFQQFVCEQSAKYKIEQLHEKCPNMTDDQLEAQMYRVGFNITSDDRFLETMRICYDNTEMRTLYVQHTLLPASIHFQKSIKRLNFSKAGYFKDLNMNHLYTQKHQRQQAAVLLQGHRHEHLFDNNTLFLARGHLAAKSDFIYGSQQRATFTFFNVAPQWQAFNGGQWAALEDEVRKFIAKSNLLVDCYTGTWGILQLPLNASDGTAMETIEYRDFYLTQDNNNNGLIPVPQLYYRVLVDRSQQTQRGIALVGVNNPHATLNEINASYVICEDIREQVAWLRWMRNKNLKKGFMYACQVADFVSAVGHLPKSLLNVTEILV